MTKRLNTIYSETPWNSSLEQNGRLIGFQPTEKRELGSQKAEMNEIN